MARFFRRGTSKIYMLPAVAAPGTGPTAPELTAGKDLSPDLAEMAGWQLTNAPIKTQNLQDRFTPQIPGEDTVANSSMTFWDQDNSEIIRLALAKGTAGFIVLAPYGAGTGKRCEVWPVTSTGVNDTWTTGNEGARFQVVFAITAVPFQDSNMP